jgi:hypothetical protein
MGNRIALLIFTIFALAELTADKLPETPSRTTPVPLTTRTVMGALPARLWALREVNLSSSARFSAQSAQLREPLADIRCATESSRAGACRTSSWPWRKI